MTRNKRHASAGTPRKRDTQATQRGAGKAGGAKAKAPGAASAEEVVYLRERVADLEKLVGENVELTERLADLQAELERLRPSGESARARMGSPPAPRRPQASLVASPSLGTALARRRDTRGGRPCILLAGAAEYFTGGGPSLAHTEIRDLLSGIPGDVDLTFLCLQARVSQCLDIRRSTLREDAEVIDVVVPETGGIAHTFAGLAPDLVMNVGPLPPGGAFRQLPESMMSNCVLNLLHGEVARVVGASGKEILPRAGAALVTTSAERDSLAALDFPGDIVVYMRGVNIAKTKTFGLDGNGSIVCITEDIGSEGAEIIGTAADELNRSGIALRAIAQGRETDSYREAVGLEPERQSDLLDIISEASTVLVPPGTLGMPQALQVGLAMGKVCLLPKDTFAHPDLSHVPGLRYRPEVEPLVDLIREFIARPGAHTALVSQASDFAREHLRRSKWARVLAEFLSPRLSCGAEK